MKVFVTGATGYLGYHIVNVLVAEGHKVLCLKRATSKSLFSEGVESRIQWVLNDGNMQSRIAAFQPDVLIHAAWGGVRGAGRDNVEIQQANLELSKTLFEAYPYKQIIGIGSQAEYGYYSNIVGEEHPLNPTMQYAIAKVACQRMLQNYCNGKNIEWQWLRIFTVFGEKQTGGLVKIAIEKCLDGSTEFDTTLGEQRYSYLYAYDFAKAVISMLGSVHKSGCYNLSQPFGIYSNRTILQTIKRLTCSDIRLNFGSIPYAENQVMLMDGHVDKFERAFGLIPCTDFETALENTIIDFQSK